MKLAEKYQAAIGQIPGADFTENATCLHVTAGANARLRVDKPSAIQKKLQVQVAWSSSPLVPPKDAAEFAAQITALSALAAKIEKGEAS